MNVNHYLYFKHLSLFVYSMSYTQLFENLMKRIITKHMFLQVIQYCIYRVTNAKQLAPRQRRGAVVV